MRIALIAFCVLSSISTVQAAPRLRVDDSPSVEIRSAHLRAGEDTIAISGVAKRTYGNVVPDSAHLDIEGLDKEGNVLVRKKGSLSLNRLRNANLHPLFTAPFFGLLPADLSVVQVRVRYHAARHD